MSARPRQQHARRRLRRLARTWLAIVAAAYTSGLISYLLPGQVSYRTSDLKHDLASGLISDQIPGLISTRIPDLAPAVALAQPGPARVIAALGADDRVILVGPSGQLYEPAGPAKWQRRTLGGVAADVRGAVITPGGRVFVAGARTPMYGFATDAWLLHPLPNRGTVTLATSREPAAAIGRNVYVWENEAWKRRAAAPGPVTALWAASNTRVYAATRGGALARLQGSSWTRIRHPLASGDHIALLAGAPGKTLHAIAQSGAVLTVGTSRARLLTRAAPLAGFHPHTAVVDRDGTLWLAGAVPAGPTASTSPASAPAASSARPAAAPAVRIVLARAQGNALELVEPIPGIAPGDRVSVLAGHGQGGLLVATERGVLLTRDSRGQWKSATISTRQAPRLGSSPGPARTR